MESLHKESNPSGSNGGLKIDETGGSFAVVGGHCFLFPSLI